MLRGMATVNLNVRVGEDVIRRIDTLCARREPHPSRNAMAAHLLSLAVSGGLTTRQQQPAAAGAPTEEPTPATPPERPRPTEEGGARLLAARRRAGLTQERVGEAAGVSEDAVRRVELGQRDLGRYPGLLAWVEAQERARGGEER